MMTEKVSTSLFSVETEVTNGLFFFFALDPAENALSCVLCNPESIVLFTSVGVCLFKTVWIHVSVCAMRMCLLKHFILVESLEPCLTRLSDFYRFSNFWIQTWKYIDFWCHLAHEIEQNEWHVTNDWLINFNNTNSLSPPSCPTLRIIRIIAIRKSCYSDVPSVHLP